MDLHDYLNVRRVFRTMASEWGCPVWVVKGTIRRIIDRNWARAQDDPKEKAVWDTHFPQGKPTPNQFVLRLGHAWEKGEVLPFFFKE